MSKRKLSEMDDADLKEQATKANAQITADTGGDREKQSTQLVNLIHSFQVQFFHTPELEPFATFPVGQHAETWSLLSSHFRLWLERQYHEHYGSPISRNGLQEAAEVFRGAALFEGVVEDVHVRISTVDDRFIVDVGDDEWRVIEITPSGWDVITRSAVKFRRPAGMLPLAIPERGGSLSDLRPFVNAPDESDWVLLQAILVGIWSPNPPYLVYNLTGEQGCAKSTRAKVIRQLTDPNVSPIRRAPREDRDFMVAANNGLVIAFDNLSFLSAALSDNITRLSTGGGFSARTLYTNSDETILDAARPVIVNGIGNVITQDDLADRSITASMHPIAPSERKTEKRFWEEFKKVEPGILGALCDAVSIGLRELPHTRLAEPPRMADFAHWVCACESGLDLSAESFLGAYAVNRTASHETSIEASPIGLAIVSALEDGDLLGTPGEILSVLETRLGDRTRLSKEWPTDGRRFTNELRRITPSLREKGIAVERLAQQRSSRGVPYLISRERLGPDSSVTSVTQTEFNFENRDSTTDSGQSPSVTAVTLQSLESDLTGAESDSSDSRIRRSSSEERVRIPDKAGDQ